MRPRNILASLFFLSAALHCGASTLPAPPNRGAASRPCPASRSAWGGSSSKCPGRRCPAPLGVEGLGLSEKNGRVLFPVFSTPILGALAKEVLEGTPLLTGGPWRREVRGFLRELLDQPPRTTIYFLFRGSEPLELTLHARATRDFTLKPAKADPAAHGHLLQLWWSEYTAPAGLLQKKPDYPPLVENYLKSTLARRLNLRLPKKDQQESPRELVIKELGLLLGSEAILTAMEQDRLLGLHNLALAADQRLPPAIDPPPLELPEPAAKVEIEPMALRVPPECFYVRFGSFSNSLWLQDTLTTWGGDMQNLLALRGLDYGMKQRMETQLVAEDHAPGPVAGRRGHCRRGDHRHRHVLPRGRGLRLPVPGPQQCGRRDGHRPAVGRARAGRRRRRRRRSRSASRSSRTCRRPTARCGRTMRRSATTTSSPRRRRSCGGSSRRRPSGKGLGASEEFRHARTIMPLSRKDTVWIYLSDAFFRNLTSPHYRIEMVRRLQAQADIEVVQLAALAAATEGKEGGSIEKLVAGGLLPPDFGPRPDGSRAVLKGGDVRDSLRGWRGALLPVPDVPVTAATAAEVTEYGKFAEFYGENWGRMDPTIIGLRRQILPGNREQVSIDLLDESAGAEALRAAQPVGRCAGEDATGADCRRHRAARLRDAGAADLRRASATWRCRWT